MAIVFFPCTSSLHSPQLVSHLHETRALCFHAALRPSHAPARACINHNGYFPPELGWGLGGGRGTSEILGVSEGVQVHHSSLAHAYSFSVFAVTPCVPVPVLWPLPPFAPHRSRRHRRNDEGRWGQQFAHSRTQRHPVGMLRE